MEEEPNKRAQTTPLPTQIPDPNTPQILPPQPSPSMEQPQPPQTTPPSQNPDPNTTQNHPNTNPPNPSQNLTPQPMEESETAQTTLPTQNSIPNPPNTTQNLPPPHLPPLPQKSNKRPLDQNGHIQNSKYFKMRAVLKDLRPHFIENKMQIWFSHLGMRGQCAMNSCEVFALGYPLTRIGHHTKVVWQRPLRKL
ncbi:hypothetical protein CsSME_00023096 [Camellia sinensis var. sinensis]